MGSWFPESQLQGGGTPAPGLGCSASGHWFNLKSIFRSWPLAAPAQGSLGLPGTGSQACQLARPRLSVQLASICQNLVSLPQPWSSCWPLSYYPWQYENLWNRILSLFNPCLILLSFYCWLIKWADLVSGWRSERAGQTRTWDQLTQGGQGRILWPAWNTG